MSGISLLRGQNNVLALSAFLPAGADPTLYTASLSVCLIQAAGTNLITNATNATPIAITSAAHGLTTGDKVAIVNVGGNGAAKGCFTITVIDANTFSLNGSVGSGAYDRGGEWYKALADVSGVAFTGTPVVATVAGSIGLVQNGAYVLVITCLGTFRDQFNAISFVRSKDNVI